MRRGLLYWIGAIVLILMAKTITKPDRQASSKIPQNLEECTRMRGHYGDCDHKFLYDYTAGTCGKPIEDES